MPGATRRTETGTWYYYFCFADYYEVFHLFELKIAAHQQQDVAAPPRTAHLTHIHLAPLLKAWPRHECLAGKNEVHIRGGCYNSCILMETPELGDLSPTYGGFLDHPRFSAVLENATIDPSSPPHREHDTTATSTLPPTTLPRPYITQSSQKKQKTS